MFTCDNKNKHNKKVTAIKKSIGKSIGSNIQLKRYTFMISNCR